MYTELYCQSNYSFLLGASHPEELVLQAAQLGYQGIAITDECSVAGLVKAYTAIKEHNLSLKLIAGSLLKVSASLRVIVICPSRQAYAELCRVISNARRRAPKNNYQVSQWDLASLKESFLIWLPSFEDDDDKWGKWLKKRHSNRVWIGISKQLTQGEAQHLKKTEQLAQKYQIPLVACGAVLMHHPKRLPLQQALHARKLGLSIQKAGRQLLSNAERSLRSLAKISELYSADSVQETQRICAACHFDFGELKYEYPSEIIPPQHTAISYLRQRVEEGAQKRFGTNTPKKIKQKIEKELKLIAELNYAHFFLTIDDIARFARQQGILYQGRGSSANSVVCYCLEITAVDPRHIDVLFERFISKERNEPPDIDVDFEHERREEVIQYIYQKYGRERAALAASVISYRFKSALKEMGKALGFNESQLDFFVKNIDTRDINKSWQHQLIELGLAEGAANTERLISLTEQLIGFPRHLSQHVGGFVISRGPLYELVPVENAAMPERTVIQWDKDDLESLGLLKVDVLALGMLTALRKAFALIDTHYKRQCKLHQITARMDDQAVFQSLHNADSVGLFQIESRAQMAMLPRIKPVCYYDLVVQIAIVRPGPIQGGMVTPYLNRRAGLEAPEYPSAELQQVLERTLGVPIFQEQVIQLAMVAAGFSGGEADALRRAMGSWGKSGKLLQFKRKLIIGMESKGYQREFAERIFEQILGFGEYGFPESHSASFALLAYASAWLKYYYPLPFYCSLLNSQPMGFYSASQLLQDAKRHGCQILPVCINRSFSDYSLEKTESGLALRVGLRQIKGLPPADIEKLLHNRNTPFSSIQEVKKIGLSASAINALASADAFYSLSPNRYQVRWSLMEKQAQPLNSKETNYSLQSCPSRTDNMLEDFQSLGLSLKDHPLHLLRQAGLLPKCLCATELKYQRHGALVNVAGLVVGRQRPGTASGVTFMTLEDHTGNSNVIVWSATASAQRRAFYASTILLVKGVVEHAQGVTHVVAGRLIDISHLLGKLEHKSRDFH
ncbi:error-prone DNA polymerase [Gilvimarinus sp. DA14]|uniref:error-prone DNA polymerase n=1 Tax=Gilvimarinus sp. DA14 TaxID=2956798 RepID=UPI0020B7B729|nr:error-prone DNA polymerase [Gilvimarinus sp. DA14]UTF60513.1 error-prone DNA polymerase [Gilvimarinus sp. DA14]